MMKAISILLTVSVLSLFVIESIRSKFVYADPETDAINQPGQLIDDLTELSIKQLMDIEIISMSKREQKLSESASAVFVITQEDIRRSGFTSIPEILRMVPGLQVAHINSNIWAVSSRGFNNIFSNKLLVMIDGRSVYNPQFTGVFWNEIDTMLEDVERIEVVRGPGATVWGSNAVNGVINIINKGAKDTQGGIIVAGAGDEERGFGAIRYGGELGANAHYRVYAKYFNRDDFAAPSGGRAWDEWEMPQGGGRIDWRMSDKNLFTFQGDVYNGHEGTTLTSVATDPPQNVVRTTEIAGGNAIARWNHAFSDDSDITSQLYYNRTERKDEIKHVVNTFDLDLHHRFAIGNRQDITWGIGYRFTDSELDGYSFATFGPEYRSDNLFSLFAQDEIDLVANRLTLTLGSKFEQNDYTGFEIQPSSRLLWSISEQHTIWASVSRAVRSPSRFENDIRLDITANAEPSVSIDQRGSRDFESENLIASEIGYRAHPFSRLSIDISIFYNIYDDLFTFEQGDPTVDTVPPLQITIPTHSDNNMDGETYGAEVFVNYQATDAWRIFAGYTYLQMQLHPGAASINPFSASSDSADTLEGDSPHNQFHLRSYLNLPFNLEFDASLYYVDSLPNQDISSYFRLDTRLGWKPVENLEMSIVFQNLLDSEHQEFGSVFGREATEVERSVYGQITLKW